MLFNSVMGREEHSSFGTSFINLQEIIRIDNFLNYLLRAGVRPSNIGIITPYEGQREFLIEFLTNKTSIEKKKI